MCFYGAEVAIKRQQNRFSEENLRNFRLLDAFRISLAKASKGRAKSKSERDVRRKLWSENYFSLVLFYFFNPVIDSMRGLSQATRLAKVMREVSGSPVSLASFSEAQHLFDPELLEKVLEELSARLGNVGADKRLRGLGQDLVAIDGALIRALPRMGWALWVDEKNRAGKLHLKFSVLRNGPLKAVLTDARTCERAVFRKMLQKDEFYVGDRGYGLDYALFGELVEAGCSFVLRVRDKPRVEVLQEYEITAEDRQAGVVSDRLVRLGSDRGRRGQKSCPVRLIHIKGANYNLKLVTDCSVKKLSAALVGLIYRHRWQIETYFKWIKCILGCRHLLAESPQGVAIQIYCALIASLLLTLATGRRPRKRAMEAIHFYFLGYATLEELELLLGAKTNQ